MNLSKFFSNARTRVMRALAGLTMLFGVGATISTVTATQQNEVVETKAGTTNANNIYFYLDDRNTGFSKGSDGGNPKVHIWNISVSTESYFASKQAAIEAAGGTWNSGDSSADFGLNWISGDDNSWKRWDLNLPWYITGCDYGFKSTNNNYWVGDKTGITAPYDGSNGDMNNGTNIYGRSGNSFSCWFSSATSHTVSTNTYTATFNSNGGSTVGSQTKKEHGKFTKPTNPTKNGFNFSKWTETNSSGASAVTFPVDVTADITYYAQWTGKTYNISVDLDGGSGQSDTTYTASSSAQTKTLAVPTPPDANHSFGGYEVTTQPTSGTVTVTNKRTLNIPANTYGDFEVAAIWTDVTYTVSFIISPSGYGSVSPSSLEDVVSGSSVSASSNVLTIGGRTVTASPAATTAQYTYAFSSWSKTSGTITSNTEITVTFTRTVRTYTILWNNHDGTTLETDTNVAYGTTPTYNGSTPTKASTSQYAYTFTGWSPTVSSVTGDATYTAQFSSTPVSYSLTYKYLDADGVSIKDATVTPTANGSTVTLPTPSKDGYSFVSWYESDGFSGTEREAGYEFTMPTSAKTFTAKFERNGFYLVDTDNGFTANASSYGSESAGVWTWSEVELDANEMLKIRYIGPDHSYEDGGWLGYNRLSSSSTAYTNFTQVIGGDNNNNIKATESDTFDIRFVVGASDPAGAIFIDWHPAFTQGYYVVGDETFNASHPWSVEGGIQLTHETTGGDLAAGTNISIPAGASFALTKYVDGHNDVWYNTWASFPDSCETVTGDKGALNLHYKGSETAVFNIYLNKDGKIYIVDQTVIAKAGYIYYASDSAKSAITLTVTNKNAEQSFPEGKHLSDVSDVLTDNNVSAFESKANLYKIPFYNLRGVLVTSEIATIVIGGSTVNVSAVSQSGSKSFYISGSSISEAKGAAAKAVFDLDEAMNGKSICDMSTSWSSLKSSIETGYAGDAELMSGATIVSYPSKTRTGTHTWPVSDIYKEICRQLRTGSDIPAWPLPASLIPAAMKNNQSPLTMTLWIVFGCGLAGLGAIGTAYFVSKKKKRNRA